MCEQDPNAEYVPVARDGYPVLMFVEFLRDGGWKATDVSRVDPGPLEALDYRARGVLRAYCGDILRRLHDLDVADQGTLRLPGGMIRLHDPEG